MGEWSDYFEQFPDENPANDPQAIRDEKLEALRARVAREARYVPPVNEEEARRAAREAVRAMHNQPNNK